MFSDRLRFGICFVLAGMCCLAGTAAEKGTSRQILAGDRVNISVREQADLSRTYAVAGDGTIDFDFAGRIAIAELSVDEAARKLEKILEKDYFKEATVTVSIANFVEGDILVTGEVATPGVLAFRGDAIMTLMEAIIKSGGLTASAAPDRVRILRWKPGGGMERETIEIDLKSMMESLDFSKDQYLRPRDIIVVPQRGDTDANTEFLALGEVAHPGFHPFTPGMDVIKAVTVMGGLGEYADWEKARILRPRADDSYAVVPLDLNRLFSAADMSVNVPMQPRDIFFVPSTRNEMGQQVYLLGEVNRKGAFTFAPGPNATLARILLAAGGVTEFSRISEVQVQRIGPDGDKKTIVVDLRPCLREGEFEKDLPIQDGDIIVVPQKVFGPGGI
jgi:protein involved in polysaccharide export with SLBB domain